MTLLPAGESARERHARRAGRGRRQAACGLALLLSACSFSTPTASNADLKDTTPDSGLPRMVGGQAATLLSAFFGLDNGLFSVANLICPGAAGKDGMPLIFSSEIDHKTMQAGDFEVTTAAGVTGQMHCVSLLPATDAGELRTVLLIGAFGDAKVDPPARVRIIGNLHSLDGTRNFRGASIGVIPLAAGPTLIMAERVSGKAVDSGLGNWRTQGDSCPATGVRQAIRVVWAGGVSLKSGKTPGDVERQLYRVRVRTSAGVERDILPMALADAADPDNNHVLCLDTADRVISVSFPRGIFQDPNGDLNPPTSVALQR